MSFDLRPVYEYLRRFNIMVTARCHESALYREFSDKTNCSGPSTGEIRRMGNHGRQLISYRAAGHGDEIRSEKHTWKGN